ncbi:MAG: hypothetical protein BGN88_08425 [Clostridiales bacterium 43-6]|nr:MAG: hypothetical protein BGN88_08425 [Clostridiales bacterium 43-6]
MNQQKPKALTVEEFIKTATMFYLDSDLEKEFENLAEADIKELQSIPPSIATMDGIRKYVRDNKKALHNLTSLLNISEERFKRIITMSRIQKKHMPTSEWSLSKIQREMIEHPEFMDEVCELFLNGAVLEKYKNLIPTYYRENFQINVSTVGRIGNSDDIRRLVKRGLEGKYSNRIGDSFFKAVHDKIVEICDQTGLTYVIKGNVQSIGRTIGIAVPTEKTPRLLIDITCNITTSSSQSDYAKTAETTASKIRELNNGKPTKQKLVFINVVDGAGWVSRRADLEKIHRCSDYLLNLRSLDTISDIVKYYL